MFVVAVGDGYHKIHLRWGAFGKEVIIVVDVLKKIGGGGDYLLRGLRNVKCRDGEGVSRVVKVLLRVMMSCMFKRENIIRKRK